MSSVKVFIGNQSIKTSKEVFRKLAWLRALATYGVKDILAPGTVCATWSVGHNSLSLGIHLVGRNTTPWPVGTFMGKRDLVAYRIKALQRSAQIAERKRGRIEISGFNHGIQENEGGTRLVSRGRSANAVVFRKAVQEAAAVGNKGDKIMLTQYATAPAPSKPTNFDASEEALINDNANYRAYISELGQLAQTGFEGFVAYTNGKKIAQSKDFDALINEIGTRQEDVLIQEVPAKVINFRQPFQVET